MGKIHESQLDVSAAAREIEGLGIHAAILKILKDGKLYAQKASRNDQQNYNYTSEADFLALMRPQLAAYDIMLFPQYEVISSSVFTTSKGTAQRQVLIRGRFNFVHVPSSTGLIVETIGEGMDVQDKAPYKAMTGALKYAIRQTFLIETGDDPESAVPEPQPAAPKSRFLTDLEGELERLKDNPGALRRACKETGIDCPANHADLVTLTGEQKRAIIAFLKNEPPF